MASYTVSLPPFTQRWFSNGLGLICACSNSPETLGKLRRFDTFCSKAPNTCHRSRSSFPVLSTYLTYSSGDLKTCKTVFLTTVVPILVCICLYIYCVVESIRDPQSPYRTPFSRFILVFIQKLPRRSQYGCSPDNRAKITSMKYVGNTMR